MTSFNQNPEKHSAVENVLDSEEKLYFNDIRRFGTFKFVQGK